MQSLAFPWIENMESKQDLGHHQCRCGGLGQIAFRALFNLQLPDQRPKRDIFVLLKLVIDVLCPMNILGPISLTPLDIWYPVANVLL